MSRGGFQLRGARITLSLGTGTISVRDCLKLARGSVVPLTEAAGADLQVSVQGVPTARAEVVVDDDTTSVRITDVLRPPNAEAQS